MGEKGNLVDELGVSGAALPAVAAATAATDPSIIERVTTTTTETVVGAGQDLAGKLRDKGIDATADNLAAEARERLHGRGVGSTEAAADQSPGDSPPAGSTQ